jgi:PAS domain S-box-containing protein
MNPKPQHPLDPDPLPVNRTEPDPGTASDALARQAAQLEIENRALREAVMAGGAPTESLFRKVFETSPDGISISRLSDGRFLNVNDGFATLSGFSRESLIGKSSLEVSLWTDPTQRQDFVARLQRNGKVQNFEARVRLGDGSATVGLISAVLLDIDGESHVLSLVRDIGQLKKAQQALQAAYRFLEIVHSPADLDSTLHTFVREIKALTDCGAAGIRILDTEGNIPYATIEGFCGAFVNLENDLSIHSDHCMCSRVIRGEADPLQPFFTDTGSFFTPSTSRLLQGLTAEQACPLRGNCNRFGYESVALIPVRAENRIIGLIHVADEREDQISLETVRLLENAALQLGAGIQRMRAEEELRQTNERLEERVAERTSEVFRSNEQLKTEVRERQRAEVRLREQQEMLQAVFNGISDPLILINQNLTVLMVNSAAVRYLAAAGPEALVGRTCRQMMQHNPEACDVCQVPWSVGQGQTVTFEREGFINPERQEQVVVYPVADPKNGTGLAVIRINDITESRLLERQVIQSEKMASLGMLVSSIAHELNNPNSFIAFNVPILREYFTELLPIIDKHAAADPEFEVLGMPYPQFRQDVFNLLGNLTHGSQRIDAFIGNLREFVRTRPDTAMKWMDLKEVVQRALAMCSSKVRKTVRTLEVDLPEGDPQIYGNPGTLEQILINLLVNAAQASNGEDSRVRLTVARGDDPTARWMITVTDNGCGMDEDTRLKIFEPFFSTKQNEGGTGLGLYICRRLLRDMGGKIKVESRSGQGSVFTVTLPELQSPGT